jgi:hypothetical protein
MGKGDQNIIGKSVNIPWAGGQNTMGKWVFITWVGCQNTMDRGVDIYVPWVGGSKYYG